MAKQGIGTMGLNYETEEAIATGVDEKGVLTSYKTRVLQKNTEQTTTGATFDVRGYESVIFEIENDFEGGVVFYGKSKEASGIKKINLVYDSYGLKHINDGANKADVYFANVSQYSYVYARIDDYHSGAVNVKATAFKDSIDFIDRKRHIPLIRKSKVSVGSEGQKQFQVYVDEFVYFYALIRAEENHQFRVSYSFRPNPRVDDGLQTSLMDREVAIEGAKLRGRSDWLEIYGEELFVHIENTDDVAHEYDLVVYGVR